MALKLKYTDEHGIVHINMSPKSSPQHDPEIENPKFDTINNRFGTYDLFGGKYEPDTNLYDKEAKSAPNEYEYNLFGIKEATGGDQPSLFRSRYNSIEEELANTPYAFATERSVRSANKLDITIDRAAISPSKDIEDNRFFNRKLSLEYDDLFNRATIDTPAFTVTQLIHAQDRYFDLSSRQSRTEAVSERTVRSPVTSVSEVDAFQVLNSDVKNTQPAPVPVLPTPKRKKEKSFAILTETPSSSRPTSPRSLPVEIRPSRVSPFKGRGFREETSRHNTPSTSAANSRNSSPPRRRTNSLSRIDKMATATLPPPITLPRPHSPRDFVRENIQDIRGLSELNREKNEAEAERKRKEEEEALLKEMELQEKISRSLVNSRVNSRSNSRVNSRSNSRTNSRSNSPSKINLRSRSNSPSTALNKDALKSSKTNLAKPLAKEVKPSKPFINKNDGMKPVAHRSRVTSRSVSKSQPQSNDGSPKHSKIPKRQSSVSPVRTTKKVPYIPRRPLENNLNNQRFISSSTSSIHETIRVGSQIHDKRGVSQSSQNLSLSPKHIKGKPPISPGRGGPPPSNKLINAKRLSPIVGTPNKSPVEDLKPGSNKTLKPTTTTTARKPVKTGNTPATSRPISRQPSRDPSPDKRKIAPKTSASKPSTVPGKPVTRTPSNKSLTKPTSGKVEAKKPIGRTDSMKSLTRTPSTKNLADKPPLRKMGSKTSLANKSNSKLNEAGKKDAVKQTKNDEKDIKKENSKKQTTDSATDPEKSQSQDNETQCDKITNDKGELVIMTKKNIVSMTTAAITSQPLEIVTTVTNQLPTTLEKAREKGIFERLSSKDSLTGKEEGHKSDVKIVDEKKKEEKRKPIFTEDHKLKPLQGPFNDPQLEKVRQKIDDILKTPEISRENILTPSAKSRVKANTEENEKETETPKETKTPKEQQPAPIKEKPEPKKEKPVKKEEEKTEALTQIRSEATKIVESIITPVEEPKETELVKEKKAIEPIVTVVNEKKKDSAGVEKVNTTLVKGEPEVEVQSSNVSTPGMENIHLDTRENGSDRSQSNGGFPQSTSTTPKPPARTKREQKEKEKTPDNEIKDSPENGENKTPNICSRLMGKCKSKCCPCCVKGEDEDAKEVQEETEDLAPKEKQGMMSKFSCCKKKTKVEEEVEREIERAAGKGATIEFEDETKRKRKLRDIICCCGRKRRVGDSGIPAQNVANVTMSPRHASPDVATDAGCCGRKRQVERRDSILSDRSPTTCCNNRLCTWLRGMCRRRAEPPTSRRASMFSKNKSLSPTLPPEDTRKKLDPALIEHTSMIRAAVPVLPIALAYFCLVCNIIVPGLGSIFSGMFCLCFGIPRFGPHDGAKYRIGSLVVNLLVGVLQLFTVLFCLVGWGWSIWWGVIMVKLARKYRRLRAEAHEAEAEAEAPPVTANNHTRA